MIRARQDAAATREARAAPRSGKRGTEVFVGIFGHAARAQKYPGKLLALTPIWTYDGTALQLACILGSVVIML